jgi:hypothetical protein
MAAYDTTLSHPPTPPPPPSSPKVTFQTELGQLIDLITAPEDSVDLSKFSLEKHHLIVVYKTAFYSFYLPVALAMRMVSVLIGCHRASRSEAMFR